MVIFGGDHADLPLQETTGELIADVLIEQRFPAVLDLSDFSKGRARRFMTDFAERLYHRNRDPLHLVLDEADLLAPQRPLPESARLLGAIDDITRRGRARGLGCALITQRPAVINKDVLSQVSTLIALQLTGVLDVKAIDEWVRLHDAEGQASRVKSSLASLPVGTAWVWSPTWLQTLQQVPIRARRTFDSSATPKVGEQRIVPTRMTPVDLAALGERITTLAEQVEQEDPARLQAQITTLRRQLKDRPSPEPVRVEVPVLTDADRELIRGVERTLTDMAAQLAPVFARVGTVTPRPTVPTSVPEVRKPTSRPETNGHTTMPKAQRTLLAVLVQNARPLTAQQLAVLSGYSIKSSGFANALGALRSAGLAVGGRDAISSTDAGREAVGDVPPLPEGPALVEHWAGQLGKAERTLLRILVDHWPGVLSADELSEVSGYSRTSSGFANALGRLRGLGLAYGGAAGIAASDELGNAATS